MATKARSGKHAAPAAVETFAPAAPSEPRHDSVSDIKPPSASRRRKPPHVKEPELSSVITVDERLKKLSRLPSLEKPVLDSEPVLQIASTQKTHRPPDPTPPAAEEPEPSKNVDRGSTIPENYGLDRLAVLPRDPHWLYVYWELHGGALERLRFQNSAEIIDNARWVLRVRPANDSGASLVDIDLRAGQWYLHVAAGTKLMVDMGFVDTQGHFTEVVKGCTVTTPRAGISDVNDERWMILREELEKLLQASGVETLSVASSDRPQMARSEQPRAIGIFSSHLLVQGSGVRGQGSGAPEPLQ